MGLHWNQLELFFTEFNPLWSGQVTLCVDSIVVRIIEDVKEDHCTFSPWRVGEAGMKRIVSGHYF